MKFLNFVPFVAIAAALVVGSGYVVGQDYEVLGQQVENDEEEYYSEGGQDKESIMYGTPAEVFDFPSVVNIATYDDTKRTQKYICSGGIIHPKWVLTEQACINLIDNAGGIDYIRIRLYNYDGGNGKPDESEGGSFKVANKILYPNYGGKRSDLNNVMLLEIKGSFGNGAVAKVQKPRFDSERGEGVIFGWGRTAQGSQEMLLKKTGLIDWQDGCINDTYTGSLLLVKATKQLLCTDFSLVEAGHECSAAGGGPLVFLPEKIFVGFISTPTCEAGSEKYMRVSYFVPWIEKVIGAKLQKVDRGSRMGSNSAASLSQLPFGLLTLWVLLKA